MIPRYTLPEMGALWEPEYKFNIWLKIEILVCEALAHRREIPASAVSEIKKKAKFDIARIDEIEKEVKHDVIAFLTCVSENVGEANRYMHLGLTSSDILDTTLAVQLKDAAKLILKELESFRDAVREQAFKPILRRGTGNLKLGKGRHVEHSGFFVHMPTLTPHKFKIVTAPETPFLSRPFARPHRRMVVPQ